VLERLTAEEKTLSTELAAIGPRLDVTHRRMIARGRAYYRYVRAGLLPAGGGFDALVDHAARVERARLAVERDLAAEADLHKRQTEIEAKITRIRAEREPLELEREAMNRARTALAEADERRAAFNRAFETSSAPDYLAIYGADLGPGDADPRSGFRSLKGRLPFPVAGRAEVRRVVRPQAGGPGLELVSTLGAPIRSVAAGNVAFADRYDEYGLTVILDHGDHYYTLYANLASADVRVGEAIASGARLGTMGGGPSGAALYFELRRGSDTVDPSPWLGL
jgi:septal ring factor EnvC (AmiA/AmiB activator)